MGQHAEDLLDWEYRKFHRPHIEFLDGPKQKPKPNAWRTKDGRVILLSDMTTDHIHNVIAMAKRKGITSILPYFEKELAKRKEM